MKDYPPSKGSFKRKNKNSLGQCTNCVSHNHFLHYMKYDPKTTFNIILATYSYINVTVKNSNFLNGFFCLNCFRLRKVRHGWQLSPSKLDYSNLMQFTPKLSLEGISRLDVCETLSDSHTKVLLFRADQFICLFYWVTQFDRATVFTSKCSNIFRYIFIHRLQHFYTI